jgi:uroporphyrin-III C-methyltransferase
MVVPVQRNLAVGATPESVTKGFGGKYFVTLMGTSRKAGDGDGKIVKVDGDKVTVLTEGLDDPKGIVYVGKRGGCKSTPQDFIQKLMITAARDGENVVRLKGGDPFIFGRGGEEREHLQAAGVKVTVINGITAGLAAVTSLGVPLTHREHAHGVVFVTGHAKPGDAGTDWRALAATAHSARLTLVIYMGMSGARRIQSELLTGLPASTPVAVIQNASLPTQRHISCKLGELANAIEADNMASPSVIVVGDVVACLALAAAHPQAAAA